jgi:hypothetical protein
MANIYSNVDIKKFGDLEAANAAGHNLRQIPSDNVDPKKSKHNVFYAGSADMNFRDVLKDKLSNFKIRKNAVKSVNLVFSASPELFADKEKAVAWEVQTWEFIKNEFGEENIIYAVVHKDEKTPHFQVSTICVDPKGKLNASHFFDGRKKCDEFITRYNNCVKNLGLKRDKGNKKSKPQDTRDFYNKVNESKKFDHRTDNGIETLEKDLKDASHLGLIATSTVLRLFKPFYDVLKRYKARYLADSQQLAEAEKIKQLNDDLLLKFDNLGLSPDMKFSECLELRKFLVDSGWTAKAENEAEASKDGGLQLDQEPAVFTKSKKSLPVPGRKRKTTDDDSDAN